MDANHQLLGRVQTLLEDAIVRVNNLDNSSINAFGQATRTLEGTSTGYRSTVKKLEKRAKTSLDEARQALTAAIRLVDELMQHQTP